MEKCIKLIIIAFVFLIFLACEEKDKSDKLSSSSIPQSSSSLNAEVIDKNATVKIGEQTWMKYNLDVFPTGDSGAAINYSCYGEGGTDNVYRYDPNKINKDPCEGIPGCFSDTPSKGGNVIVTLTYKEIEENCEKYGRLYDWATAMNLPKDCNEISCAKKIKTHHQGICPEGFHIPSKAEFDRLLHWILKDNKSTNAHYKNYIAADHLKTEKDWEHCSYKNNNNGACLDTYGFSALPGGYRSYDAYFHGEGSGYFWSATEDDDGYSAYNLRIGTWGVDNTEFSKSNSSSVRCVKD